MLIINKKKYFNEIYTELFKKNMRAIDDMNNLLTYYGAKPHIEKDKYKFILATYLFNLFFLEGALQSKYLPQYQKEVSQIIEASLSEIARRINYEQGKVFHAYLSVRKKLGDMALDDHFTDINPTYIASIWYLIFVFNEEYKPEELGYEAGEVETVISTAYHYLINDTVSYLDSL